jgi:hypothetical protein
LAGIGNLGALSTAFIKINARFPLFKNRIQISNRGQSMFLPQKTFSAFYAFRHFLAWSISA